MAVSTNFQCNDYERLRELTFLAQIGWWEANFATRTFRCSEYIYLNWKTMRSVLIRFLV